MNKNNDNTINESNINLRNVAIIDFNLEKKQVNFKLNKKIIKQASEIFTRDIFNYAKAGGDMKSIKLKNVYGGNVLSK